MDNSKQSSSSELEKPPTLVAESAGSEKISSGSDQEESSMIMSSGEDKSAAKMPVLHPNVTGGVATRTKSGRIHKPARNFNSDEYVVPTLVKRRVPNNSRPAPIKEKEKPAPILSTATVGVSEIELVRSRLEQKLDINKEVSYEFLTEICFKECEKGYIASPSDIQTRIKNSYKTWSKGPYRLKEDEVKFIQECFVKPGWMKITVKDWRILEAVLRERAARMKKRFARPGRPSKKRSEDMKKTFTDLGNKIVKGKQTTESDSDKDYQVDSDDLDAMEEDFDLDNSSSHSSRLSTRSKDANAAKGRGGNSSKTPSILNNDTEDFDLGTDGIDDFAGEEEMFDDLESALVNESKDKDGNSLVAALHATLQTKGQKPELDSNQFEPPALDKDGSMYALDDMEGAESFFETAENANFVPQSAITDEDFAELEQRIVDEDEEDVVVSSQEGSSVGNQSSASSVRKEKLDLSTVEIEESSGNVRLPSSGGDLSSPCVTMISTKIALMCALKISEDFLPSSHEKYLNRLEETEKYGHDELNDIRKKFNMKPTTAVAGKRKLHLISTDSTSSNKKVKITATAEGVKVLNGAGTEKPKTGVPYLRSAYAKSRKFMEDETTVIEKLGNNKILASGKIIEVDYENYVKESDVKIPYDETIDQQPKLLPPSVSNCHAPPCRLGCICSSISEDMPPRKHCGRPKCFFECNCQQLLLNNSDDGDIRSRLRPRVSLLNWRAESTEKEKEPMTSYRQMERGATHLFRVRRTAAVPERLRRDFVHDGQVVERVTAVKATNTKERLSNRTKALLQSSHRRMMGKHDSIGHGFLRIIPNKPELKPKPSLQQQKKMCTPVTIDVKHLDIEITPVNPQPCIPSPSKRQFIIRKEPIPPKMAVKDIEEMNSIIKEMTEDCQIMMVDDKVAYFSWSTGVVQPKVIMYQIEKGDECKVPWLYLPIPPQGYSWICHALTGAFEQTDYVYIPEIKCSIPSQALRVNMNTAFIRKKGVVFDVKATGNAPGIGKIYFFPDMPKVLVCGPFRTDQTTVIPEDPTNAETIESALEHMQRLRLMNRFGNDQSWKKFTTTPTIFPIKKRSDNEVTLNGEESRKLFAKLYPSLIDAKPIKISSAPSTFIQPTPPKEAFAGGWANAARLVGFGQPPTASNKHRKSLTDVMRIG